MIPAFHRRANLGVLLGGGLKHLGRKGYGQRTFSPFVSTGGTPDA